ncbi:MAG: hypothetical protein JO180_00315, partial [Gemmatirosa sp.]|nr:hypothetical protein [Gemmatirosa sp.]
VARDVEDPETRASVWKRQQAATLLSGSPDERREARAGGDLRIGALGSGSDYTAFLDHVGVASMNLGFGGEDDGGIYHSIYDDVYWYTHFSDTSFVYGRALAQTAGTTVMRLAGADLLPFAFGNLAETARRYASELQQLRDRRAEQLADRRRDVEGGVYAALTDPRDPTVAPPVLAPPPQLEFAAVQNAVDALARAAARYEQAASRALDRGAASTDGGTAAAPNLAAVNARLLQAERALTAPEGLARRPWFKHLLYAPGWYTGYGVKTMPGAREAIEQDRWRDADPELARIAAALQREAALVDELADALGR